MTQLEKIRANAELVVDRLRPLSGLGTGFGYNRASVEWVEGYIERLRTSDRFRESQAVENITAVLGSFLGECIARTYGGEWREQDGRWGVFFGEKDAAFPFAKVMKQFENGLEGGDSILGFFDVLPDMLFKQ